MGYTPNHPTSPYQLLEMSDVKLVKILEEDAVSLISQKRYSHST